VPPELLTPREKEILNLIAAGYSNQAIAAKLVIAIGTVKRHITNIYGKLDVSTREQAIAKAHEQNLITLYNGGVGNISLQDGDSHTGYAPPYAPKNPPN
jgi:DNA-binding CsgD family transcriptional regulator